MRLVQGKEYPVDGKAKMKGRRKSTAPALVAVLVSCAAAGASAFCGPPVGSLQSSHRRAGWLSLSSSSSAAAAESSAAGTENRALGEKEEEEVLVALTREDGKNTKLLRALMSHPRIGDAVPVDVEEIPCIEHADGSDADRLVPALVSSSESESTPPFDYVAVTSPEAARVLASAWEEADRPDLGGKVCAVGKATGEALEKLGIDVAFVPSKATAKTLAKELPESETATAEGRSTTLLYPASAKARPTLQEGLEGRGFEVTRLDAYDTVPARWSAERAEKARGAGVACFASPSAVDAWVENLGGRGGGGGEGDDDEVKAACIGETSAQGCRDQGWAEEDIYYPEKPGVEGWADAVADALEAIAVKRNG